MKAAIYLRVSTDKQDISRQSDICKQYCFQRKIEIFNGYSDIESGSKESRPSFNKMLEDMRQGKFDTVVVTKLDRIGRSLKHLLSLFDEFTAKGINFVAVTQNIDTSTSAGKLQMQIIGAFAEFERNLISERTKEGLKGNTKVGKRGKDKKPRKKGGYILRHNPHLKKKYNLE